MITVKLKLAARHQVVAIQRIKDECVVLVELLDNPITPFVTYGVDEEGICYAGDYCGSIAEAWPSYGRRSARILARHL